MTLLQNKYLSYRTGLKIRRFIRYLMPTWYFVTLAILSCDELEPVNPADPAYILEPPTLTQARAKSDTEVELRWLDNDGHTLEFAIFRKMNNSLYAEIAVLPKDILTYTDSNCVLGILYSYAITSKHESNQSELSNEWSAVTVFPPPDKLSVIPISDESVRLTWTDNTGYETGFTIERDGGSGFTEIGRVLADVIGYTDTGLNFGQSYDYRVAAITVYNTSDYSNTVSQAIEFPAPSELTASSVSDSEIQLTWTDNTGYETGFKIERDDDGSGFVEIGTVLADVTEYTDVGLSSGESYDYRVAAYTARITSDYSTSTTALTCSNCVGDYDGNVYETIQIGDQEWMAENLKVTHYRDGTAITNVTDNAAWAALTTEAYCIYNNNASNELDTYGAMYNWYAVNGDTDGDGVKDKEIAPAGWHVPTDAEWTTLTDHLASAAGGKLKETGITHWNDPNTGATNESGFTALPGGYRHYYGGYYGGMGYYGYFWSAPEGSSSTAWYRILNYNYSDVDRSYFSKSYGFSIRCVRD